MPERVRVVGTLITSDGKSSVKSRGKEIPLANGGELPGDGNYRLVGTLDGGVLTVEFARKLEEFDMAAYERALSKSLPAKG